MEWLRATVRDGISWDAWADQELLALKLDGTITVPSYTGDVWWFVQDVNGLERAITADTLIFDRPFERAFPFHMVEPRPLQNRDEENEATVALNLLRRHRAQAREREPPLLTQAA